LFLLFQSKGRENALKKRKFVEQLEEKKGEPIEDSQRKKLKYVNGGMQAKKRSTRLARKR